MDVSALAYQFSLPPDLFQDRDTLAALRATQRLPEMAHSLCLRIGMLTAAAVACADKDLQDHSMRGVKATVEGLHKFRDFLQDPANEGEIHPQALRLLEEVRGARGQQQTPLKDLADATSAVVTRWAAGTPPTEADLMKLMGVAHGDFPKWLEGFQKRIDEESAAVRTSLETKAREARERAMASQNRIADVARTIRLISLNARVEAARAGETGKAFGVIADEIKALSERTADASGQVAEDIECMAQILAN